MPRARSIGRARGPVAAVASALVLAACTGTASQVDAPPVTAADGPAESGVDSAVPADVPSQIQGGDGACTQALRTGPLIDPERSGLGEPPPGSQPFPIVNLPRLDTCELSSTADWFGRPLVVNVWASWCAPCRAEMPELSEFAVARSDDVDLVGLNVDFRQEDAEGFLDEVPVSFPSWFDPDQQVLGPSLSIRAMPTTFFVDPDGIIVHRHLGPISRSQLDTAVATHLGT